MTTADFIAKTYNVTSTKERRCSSVFTDHEGTVYSYGYHFPLLIRVAGLNILNNSSYSSTTAKHQAWARSATNYDYIPVKLNQTETRVITARHTSEQDKLMTIRWALERELESLQGMMATKKQKDTQVYKMLEDRATQVAEYINTVRSKQELK